MSCCGSVDSPSSHGEIQLYQAFFDAVAADKDLGATRGIDGTLQTFALDALLLPTDVSSTPAAIAGYPIVTGASASTCPSTQT